MYPKLPTLASHQARIIIVTVTQPQHRTLRIVIQLQEPGSPCRGSAAALFSSKRVKNQFFLATCNLSPSIVRL